MKETADQLKTVKTHYEMPESLEDVDFEEVRREFVDMTDLAKTFRMMRTDKMPDQLKDLNFQDLEADF
jgi:hypothetical protein